MKSTYNHARVGPLRKVYADLALLNDVGHDFACLHYYIDHAKQREQLRGRQFEVVEVLDCDGAFLYPDQTAPYSPHLVYVAEKRA